MIENRERLFLGCPPAAPAFYSLRLVDHFFIEPLSRRFNLIITGAWRSKAQQDDLRYADGRPVPADQKAKGTSQHTLGEAVDFGGADEVLRFAWLFAVQQLQPWQAILYLHFIRDQGVYRATSFHLSIPSYVESIRPKKLLNIDGRYSQWEGKFPGEAA